MREIPISSPRWQHVGKRDRKVRERKSNSSPAVPRRIFNTLTWLGVRCKPPLPRRVYLVVGLVASLGHPVQMERASRQLAGVFLSLGNKQPQSAWLAIQLANVCPACAALLVTQQLQTRQPVGYCCSFCCCLLSLHRMWINVWLCCSTAE